MTAARRPVEMMAWEKRPDSGYIRLVDIDDLWQIEGDPDPREGLAQRLELTVLDLRRAIKEDRESGPRKTKDTVYSRETYEGGPIGEHPMFLHMKDPLAPIAKKPEPIDRYARGCANCQHPPHDDGPCKGEPDDLCDCTEPETVGCCNRCGVFQNYPCICYAR